MSTRFCITIRFLDSRCHARGDGGEPEWPPSPLRLFQSLVAASAARWNERTRLEHAAPALHWLEKQQAPEIVAPVAEASHVKYRLYVPDNVADKVGKSWSAGRDASIADYRTEKDVRPTHLRGGDAIHYLYQIDAADCPHLDDLSAAARSITHLGWGVDMVVASASVISDKDSAKLSGERWRPVEDRSFAGYRVPIPGTLDALSEKHGAFLNRLGANGFRPVSPLSAFQVVNYRRATDSPLSQFAAFGILKPDASAFRAFDTVRRGVSLAGMMRCAAKKAARIAAWPDEKVNAFVLGHGEAKGESHRPVNGPRFAYIPLPSIEHLGDGQAEVVGAVRRALVMIFGNDQQREIDWARRALSGVDLVAKDDHQAKAILSLIPNSDRMVKRYTRRAATWSTITPIVLPGYDDPNHYRRRLKKQLGSEEQHRLLARLDNRIELLLRKAIAQAGHSEILAQNAQIEWRTTGFRPGADLAMRYTVPEKLRRFPRYHARITWRNEHGNSIELPGPICLGGGRYYGLGLFAPCD
jgi:CRISPR-associated protein Csb2